MKRKQKQVGHIYKMRAAFRRRKRLLFSSPAEIELIRIMGGKTITVDFIREPRNNFPLCFVVSMGDIFKREHIHREVRAGAFWIDFGNDIQRGIECDGKLWHQDILHEQQRNEYVAKYGWLLMHIPASEIYKDPKRVHDKVVAFLEK